MKATFIHCCSSTCPFLEQAFRCYCVDPLVSSDADRWGYTKANMVMIRINITRMIMHSKADDPKFLKLVRQYRSCIPGMGIVLIINKKKQFVNEQE